MRKLSVFAALAIGLALAPAAARADQPVAGRWFQLLSTFGSNPCGAGKACIYRNGTTLHFVDHLGADTALGAGGGGTLATTYAAGASTSDSIMALDATRGKLVIKDNATPIGGLLDIQASAGTSKFLFDASNMTFGANRGIATVAGIGAFDFSNATGIFSTSVGTNTLSGNVSLASGKTFVYAGGASTFDASASSGVFKTTTGAHTFGSASWAVPANLVMTGSASSTNTVGMLHTSNVADGATSVGQRFNNTTAATTDGNLAFQFQNAGTDRFTIGRTSSAWKFTVFGDADSTGNGPLLIKSSTSSAGVTMDATTAGGRIYQVYSTSAGLFNLADITAGLNRWQMDSSGHWSPSADNSYDLGIASTNRVRTANIVRTDSVRLTSPTQNMSFSATPAFNCTLGGVIHIGTITANVTGPTMTGGVAGERCTIVFLKDGTAGAFTIAGWASNVRFNGTATFTTGAGSLVVLSFVWDDRLGTPAWVETARATYN